MSEKSFFQAPGQKLSKSPDSLVYLQLNIHMRVVLKCQMKITKLILFKKTKKSLTMLAKRFSSLVSFTLFPEKVDASVEDRSPSCPRQKLFSIIEVFKEVEGS